MSEFIVKLDGIKLPKNVEAEIGREIQAVVLRELAKIDLRGDLTVRIPWKDWIGIWARTKAFDAGQLGLKVNELGR